MAESPTPPTQEGFYWWRRRLLMGDGWTAWQVVWVGSHISLEGMGQVLGGRTFAVSDMTVSEWEGPLVPPSGDSKFVPADGLGCTMHVVIDRDGGIHHL